MFDGTIWKRKNVLVKFDTAVLELAEGSSLLELGGLLGVLLCDTSQSQCKSFGGDDTQQSCRDDDAGVDNRFAIAEEFEITYVFVSHDRGGCRVGFACRCNSKSEKMGDWTVMRSSSSSGIGSVTSLTQARPKKSLGLAYPLNVM
jgi:hypothetical protein